MFLKTLNIQFHILLWYLRQKDFPINIQQITGSWQSLIVVFVPPSTLPPPPPCTPSPGVLNDCTQHNLFIYPASQQYKGLEAVKVFKAQICQHSLSVRGWGTSNHDLLLTHWLYTANSNQLHWHLTASHDILKLKNAPKFSNLLHACLKPAPPPAGRGDTFVKSFPISWQPFSFPVCFDVWFPDVGCFTRKTCASIEQTSFVSSNESTCCYGVPLWVHFLDFYWGKGAKK